MKHSMQVTTPFPFPEAVAVVRAALAEHGFGVLTEIDVRATLADKLGVDVSPMVILGACRPELAHRAVAAVPGVATLLPCNVVVRQAGGSTLVEAIDPDVLAELDDNPELVAVAAEARRLLRSTLAAVAGTPHP